MQNNAIVRQPARQCRCLNFATNTAWFVAFLGAGHPDAFGARFDWRAAAAAKIAYGRDALSRSAAASAHSSTPGKIVSFDAPGAGTAATQGTIPLAINAAGTVTGYYIDPGNAAHGFVRSRDGAIITFDPPGATSTYATAINAAGTIVGYDNDANGVHGFLRDFNGSFAPLVGPHGVALSPAGISREAVVTGSYSDANTTSHGFRLAPNGDFIGFEAPGAGTLGFAGTQAFGITARGTIVVTYYDIDFNQYEFLRTRNGVFINVTGLPGPLRPPESFLFPVSPFSSGFAINTADTVAGSYVQPLQNNPFGYNVWVFTRDRNGIVTRFAAADYSPCCIWSWATDINDAGAVAGYFNDGYNVNHGFVRTADGTITTFDAPDAGPTGTAAAAINANGAVTGPYFDANHVIHGFLRAP